jgi:hypothetical protein
MKLDELLKKAVAAYEALPPLEKARHNYDQRRSWVRGEMGLEYPNMPADELERLLDAGFERMGVVRP